MSSSPPLLHLLLFQLSVSPKGSFRFFHGPTVYAYLHACAGTQKAGERFPTGSRFLACESGRIRYAKGDVYHVGMALKPTSAMNAKQWVSALRSRPASSKLAKAPLGNHTRLLQAMDLVGGQVLGPRADAVPLDESTVRRAAARLVGAREITVRMDSPLLILRTPVEKRDTFFDERIFVPDTFLDRVQRAIRDWFPDRVPSKGPDVELLENRLVRAETRYHGKAGVKVILGAAGSVKLRFREPLDEPWAVALLLAGVVGIGKSTDMGQGRFSVEGCPLVPGWPPRPATSLCEHIARAENLDVARDGVVRGGSAPGIDETTRGEFLDAFTLRRTALAESIECKAVNGDSLCLPEDVPVTTPAHGARCSVAAPRPMRTGRALTVVGAFGCSGGFRAESTRFRQETGDAATLILHSGLRFRSPPRSRLRSGGVLSRANPRSA